MRTLLKTLLDAGKWSRFGISNNPSFGTILWTIVWRDLHTDQFLSRWWECIVFARFSAGNSWYWLLYWRRNRRSKTRSQRALNRTKIGSGICPLKRIHSPASRRRSSSTFCREIWPGWSLYLDLYSIALSKIARGFESDLEDVEFMLKENLISWEELEADYQSILPEAHNADINPKEFKIYFATLKQRIKGWIVLI